MEKELSFWQIRQRMSKHCPTLVRLLIKHHVLCKFIEYSIICHNEALWPLTMLKSWKLLDKYSNELVRSQNCLHIAFCWQNHSNISWCNIYEEI